MLHTKIIILAISLSCTIIQQINCTQKGKLEVICGSMFSGKTEELIRRLRRAEYANKRILTIKAGIDTRYSKANIVSHCKNQRAACSITSSDKEDIHLIVKLAQNSDIVGIDEVQFFDPSIMSIIDALIDNGKDVVVAGLDLDFRGEPFGIMPILMSHADNVTKLKAICVSCGKDAHFSQRLIDGRPAKYDDPIILVGDVYEARCRDCFVLVKAE